MGTQICLFFDGKMGFHELGLGFIHQKTIKMGMGLRFEQESHCNDGICAVAHWD
jgi:hypothetical protein